MKTTVSIGALLLCLAVIVRVQAETSPAATLDAFYRAGASANQSVFIAQLTEDAVLLGVYGGARLQGQSLRDYVSESLPASNAWAYHRNEREIRLSADGSVAWFDEALQHEQLGAGRASGVLVENNGNWKIAQYNVSTPLSGPVSPAGAQGAAANTAIMAGPQKPKCKESRHKTNSKGSC